jgi:methylenetetrahydrofolate dehydrogenase (NADP+)/methenyltetrahydrofolate cyclohydrolase
MTQINGADIARKIIDELKLKPIPKKILAVVLVGQNPASLSFIKQKEKLAKELAVDFRVYKFPENISADDLRQEVGKISQQKPVGGVIVQLPLPKQINAQYVLNAIPREKDIDVLGERALGAFYAGRSLVLPPSVGVVEEILKSIKYQVSSIKVAVVGLGFLIGKPIANWLMGKCPEIYLLDIGSDFEILKQVDLVITGVGKAGLIKPEMLKDSATVIDFGYDTKESQSANRKAQIKGDFDSERLAISDSRLAFYTPTPGGTGPILVAKLFENFYGLNS